MKTQHSTLKKLSQLGTLLILSVYFSGCAGGGSETDWASYQDSSSQQDDLGAGPIDEITPIDPEDNPDDDIPPVEEPDPKVYFYNNGRHYSLARNQALKWEGCHSTAVIRGGYLSNTSCGNAYLYDKFVTHLNRHFFTCVEKAASKANYSQVSRVFVHHVGSYNDRTARNSTRLSMHAYARALDIKYFNLIDSQGNVTRVSTNINDFRGATAKFYDEFRGCWKATMPSNCVSGQTEYQGSIGHNSSSVPGRNSLHNDHIHLSFPFCAGA